MSTLLSGPNAIAPWIGESVAEHLSFATAATTSSATSAARSVPSFSIRGPRLAQVLQQLPPSATNATSTSPFPPASLHLSDGQVSIVAVISTPALWQSLQAQDFCVGCLVRLTAWQVTTHHLLGQQPPPQQCHHDGGDSLRFWITDEVSIVGGRGLATVNAHGVKDVHSCLAVRRVLADMHWQWNDIRHGLSLVLQHQQQQVVAPQSNKNQNNNDNRGRDTNQDDSGGTETTTITTPVAIPTPLGNLAALLGVQQQPGGGMTSTSSNDAHTSNHASVATTTDQVQDLFGRVLREAEKQKQNLDQRQEQQQNQSQQQQQQRPPLLYSQDASTTTDEEYAQQFGFSAMLVPLVESDDDDDDSDDDNDDGDRDNKHDKEQSQQGEAGSEQEEQTTQPPPTDATDGSQADVQHEAAASNSQQDKEIGKHGDVSLETDTQRPQQGQGDDNDQLDKQQQDAEELLNLETQPPPIDASQDETEIPEKVPMLQAAERVQNVVVNAPELFTQPLTDDDQQPQDEEQEQQTTVTTPSGNSSSRGDSQNPLPLEQGPASTELFTQPIPDSEDDDDDHSAAGAELTLATQPEASLDPATPPSSENRAGSFTPIRSANSQHRRGSTGGISSALRSRTATRRGSTTGRLESVHDLNLDMTLGALPRKPKREWKNVPTSYIEMLRKECAASVVSALELTDTSGEKWAGGELRTLLAAALPPTRKKQKIVL